MKSAETMCHMLRHVKSADIMFRVVRYVKSSDTVSHAETVRIVLTPCVTWRDYVKSADTLRCVVRCLKSADTMCHARRSESSGSQTQRATRYALNKNLRLPPASLLQLQLSGGFLRGTAATFSSAGRRVLTLTLRRDASRVLGVSRLPSDESSRSDR
ncbi:hypothetical protein NDU88_000317 [Pleurodeles waltl]|uniref:Uncharacterized protein n=1 Tax=Pleurodeles waltl TaxID=8319 RepID=A0AAV7P7X9_PLEWA|nr:hypothetical protein NDU88_000317 [Pleurodeles waltl]